MFQRVKIDVPDPKADEVLLKVEVVSLNAFDWKIQKGVSRPILPRKFPYVPGLSYCIFSQFTQFP